jgi:hypothetical protein
MPFWDNWFKSDSHFKTGTLKTPTKFKVVCNRCGKEPTPMLLPAGTQEPSVHVECPCGNGEVLYVL